MTRPPRGTVLSDGTAFPVGTASAVGTVFLVGAGPGDPDLITVRGLRCLQGADVVLYDRLLHPALLDEAPDDATRIFVGKSPGQPGLGQTGIHRLLINHARRGRRVVRLKGGDPFVFGRGSEEAEALTAAGIPWEVVPAVTSAVGVPASVGIPLTHRRLARSFAVVTAHQAANRAENQTGDVADDRAGNRANDHAEDHSLDWNALARIDTLVVLMGVAALPSVARELIAQGKDPQTPAAIIARGTLPDARVVSGTLNDLPMRAAASLIRSPATIVIGEVVGLRHRLIDDLTGEPLAHTPTSPISDLPLVAWERKLEVDRADSRRAPLHKGA